MTDPTRAEPDLPREGPALARELQRRHPGDDWLAALSKAAGKPRGDVERYLQEPGTLPQELNEAARQVGSLLSPDAAPGRDAFARTNDVDAPMEVDAEAGAVVLPSNKGMPSQSGSEHEMRTKPPAGEKNGEFLPLIGVPELIMPLHKKTG
jgi:hypothetical protein